MQQIQQVQRPTQVKLAGWMWLMFGTALFPDKSSNGLRSCCVLEVKDDIDSASSHAWGAAVLAYLYRHLGIASRAGAAGVAGCLTLLQAWIYEYFPCFRPGPRMGIRDGQARAAMWVPRQEKKVGRLDGIRARIDQLTADEVFKIV